MTVYKYKTRGGTRYRYHFELNGRRYTERGFSTRQLANDAATDKRREVESGRSDPYPKFKDLVGAFLTSSQRTKSADWAYQLEVKLSKGFKDLADLPPRKITTAHIDRCLTRLAADRRSARSLNEYRKIIISVFSYAVKAEAVDYNPAARIAKVPEPEAQVQPILKTHLQQLILAADPAMAALLTVQSQTGARFVELVRLRTAEVFIQGERPFCLLSTKKNVGGHERKRPQPLTQLAVAALLPLISAGREYVFYGVAGGRLNYDSELHRLQDLCDKLGLPRYSWHQVRHWAGFAATSAGGSRRAIAGFLGQTSLGAVERYMHAIDPQIWEIAKQVEREMADGLAVDKEEQKSGT